MVLDDLLEKEHSDGLAEGLTEGRNLGLVEGEHRVLVRYLANNPDAESASKLLGFPIETVRKAAQDNGIVLRN